MQWEVSGTQGGSGLARSIVVNADDAAQARRLGTRQGWKVESVHPVGEPKPMTSPPPPPGASSEATPVVAPAPEVRREAAPRRLPDPAVERLKARAGTLKRTAVAVGILGGLFVFAGALLAGAAAAMAPAGQAGRLLIAGLSAGLPVVAAGVLQLVAALVTHILADAGHVICGQSDRGEIQEPRTK